MKPGPDDGFWRGMCWALPLSVLIWLAIFALIYTGLHA